MTVQEISDEFTLLSHQGKAQAAVMHISGEVVKNITGIELIGDDIALIISEKTDPELKDKLLDLKANCDLAIEGRDLKIIKLEKENEELKEKENTVHTLDVLHKEAVRKYGEANDQLTKAIGIIKRWYETNISVCIEPSQELIEVTEQFLKEV